MPFYKAWSFSLANLDTFFLGDVQNTATRQLPHWTAINIPGNRNGKGRRKFASSICIHKRWQKLCLTRKTQFWVENIKVHLNQSRGKDKHFCSWEMTSSCISIFSYRIGLQYLSNVIAENFQLILSWLSPSCTFIVSCLNEKTHIKRLEMTIKGSHNSTLWMFFKTIPHHYTFFECL